MKTVFIEARHKGKISLTQESIKKIKEKKIALLTTVQFLDSLKHIKKQLKDAKKDVIILTTKHSKHKGQILGCGVEKFEESDSKLDAFLYVGDGMFHPKTLLIKNNKPVYCYNPFNKKLTIITEKDIEKNLKRTKGAYLKFLTSEKIGVLISTKPGQKNMKDALNLEKKFKNKKFYYLLFNTLDFNQLENFPFIECFVNTACARIAYDDYTKFNKPVLDIRELIE